jgi:hypothetical protein
MQLAKFVALAAIAAVLAAFVSTQPASAENYLCRQQFALCTSAPCIPQPGSTTSLATVPCDTVKPSIDEYGVRTVYSQYSPKQWQQGKKTLTCASGAPWTWCLNKICTVDPANPKKAICACDIVRTGASVTAGGNCNTGTCNTAYWSAAPADAFADGTDFFMKSLNIKKSPVQACPTR